MIYAHLSPTLRDVYFCAECFVGECGNSVDKVSKSSSVIKVKLKGGDEHHFMNGDAYRKWSMGRTYILDGILYHSGYPQAKGGDDDDKGRSD